MTEEYDWDRCASCGIHTDDLEIPFNKKGKAYCINKKDCRKRKYRLNEAK